MQQITASLLGLRKVNCLGKALKFQYNKICIADRMQQQRTEKYWNQLPLSGQNSLFFSVLYAWPWKQARYFHLNSSHRADTEWGTGWGGIGMKVQHSQHLDNFLLRPRVELLTSTQTTSSLPSHSPSTLLVWEVAPATDILTPNTGTQIQIHPTATPVLVKETHSRLHLSAPQNRPINT